eukprot:gnl/TRDRNA2_/TRDRNA2_126931_c0_seq1.p1 gnl/TRDRNA2_/TRDRNA2_126931_c0~~gnl/TRDRNA2_/TRDRNA2_126931_c0_seq1.p1  ORF type:complete len:207 (+),score=19.83 gnl/TRDRNA2_/TRDRNA2_126931_c0_seq1:2-622(+)
MRTHILVFLLAVVAEAQPFGLRTPQQRSGPLAQHVRPLWRPYRYISRGSMFPPQAEQGSGGAYLRFELGEQGGQILGKEYTQNQFGDVKALRTGNSGDRFFVNLGNFFKRPIGKEVSEEDWAVATSDLSGLLAGEVAIVKRSDGTWRYAKCIERDGFAQTSSGVVSLPAVALFGLLVSIGGIYTLAVLRFRQRTLTASGSPLLTAA